MPSCFPAAGVRDGFWEILLDRKDFSLFCLWSSQFCICCNCLFIHDNFFLFAADAVASSAFAATFSSLSFSSFAVTFSSFAAGSASIAADFSVNP